MPYTQDRLSREVEFHDQWAKDIAVDDIDVRVYFEGSTCPENRYIMRQIGNLRGKRILDIGCGAGENSVYFALQGAQPIAADISPGMIGTAQKLAATYGVSIEGKVADAMALDFPDDSFDVVYTANTLHHVEPLIALREMWRVAKPGGKICFWEPLRHNPFINMYRKKSPDVRTADEMPLHINIVRQAREMFSDVAHDTFWFASLWIFLRFSLVEHADPNEERYWKKIVYEEERLRPLYYRLEKIDNLIKKIPFLRRYAGYLAVVATK